MIRKQFDNVYVFQKFINATIAVANYNIILRLRGLTKEELECVVSCLKSGKCPAGLSIDIEDCELGDLVAYRLAEAIEFGNCPKNLSIGLAYSNYDDHPFKQTITFRGVDAFSQALKNAPEGFTLSINGGNVNVSGAESLAEALKGGNTPKNLTLWLKDCNADQCLQSFIDVLNTGTCSEGLHLMVSIDTKEEFINYIHCLKSCPKNFYLNLSTYTSISDDDFEALANVIAAGECPTNLNIILNRVRINERSIRKLMCALSSEKCPEGISIDFESCNLDERDLDSFIELLKSGKFCKGLSVNLSGMFMSDSFIKELSDALKLDCNRYKELKLNLTCSQLTIQQLNILLSIFNSENFTYPEGLKLCLGEMDVEDADDIVKSIMQAIAGKDIKNLQIELYEDDLEANTLSYIKDEMLKNTSITELKLVAVESEDEKINALNFENLRVIERCCMRNKCLIKYPEHETFIKRKSQKDGLYQPIEQIVIYPSLYKTTAAFLNFNPQPVDRLASDQKDFLKLLKRIELELEGREEPVLDDEKSEEYASKKRGREDDDQFDCSKKR